MIFPHPPGGGDDPAQVSDDDNVETPVVSDDEDDGGLGRAFHRKHQATNEDEADIFAPEIHLKDPTQPSYFTWLPGLINNCLHSFVGGWAYVLIQYMSRMLSERQQRSTMEAIRAREEELQYLHYASTH